MPLKRTLGFGHSCILRLAGAFSLRRCAPPRWGQGRRARHATCEADAAVRAAHAAHAASSTRAARARRGAATRAALCFSLAALLAVSLLPVVSRSADAAEGDVLVVALDMGHGQAPVGSYYDPGASGYGVVEATAVTGIAQACADELSTYEGVKVVFTGRYESRKERVQSAVDQGADVVVSFHCNSADVASANGSEVWINNDSAYRYETHVEGKGLGTSILAELESLGFNNRGVKTRSTVYDTYPDPGGKQDWYGINLYARYAGIPGLIVEHAFVTNEGDAAKLASAEWRSEMGKADARGIANYYGLSKKADGDGGGSSSGSGLEQVGEEVVSPAASLQEDDPAIMGSSRVSSSDLAVWFSSKGKTFPSDTYTRFGASSIEEFCRILCEEAEAEGVRAEVVFAQAMNETGWFGFGGQVKPEQCNFCGLGATDGGPAGADFGSYGADGVRMGLRAQVQHLKAYASTDPLNQECVDGRFHLVTRGSAPTVKGLSGKWASSQTYGDDLTRLINDLLSHSGAVSQETPVKFSLADVPDALVGSGAVAYVDGVATPLSVSGGYGTVKVSGSGAHSIVLYEYAGDTSNAHASYPTGMYVWIATEADGAYSTRRYYGLDDLLQYAGSSIRVSGNKGIRMITGVSEDVKQALSGSGLCGFTLQETGTLLAWSDRVENGSLIFATSGASRGRAYVRGSQNPVFSQADGTEYYTNVLVGFSTVEQYKRDMAMRSYAILMTPDGQQVTVYGGVVERSICYIAEQNADAFPAGSAAYEFVHGIIDACKE